MSFTITTDLFCDECFNWTEGIATHKPARAKAWKIAKSRGWKKISGKHYCWDCAVKRQSKKWKRK